MAMSHLAANAQIDHRAATWPGGGELGGGRRGGPQLTPLPAQRARPVAGSKRRARDMNLAFVGPPDSCRGLRAGRTRPGDARCGSAWRPTTDGPRCGCSRRRPGRDPGPPHPALHDRDPRRRRRHRRGGRRTLRGGARGSMPTPSSRRCPPRLDLDVKDATAEATVQVVNVGNVAVEIPDISAFGLMMEGGVETAIGSGLMSSEHRHRPRRTVRRRAGRAARGSGARCWSKPAPAAWNPAPRPSCGPASGSATDRAAASTTTAPGPWPPCGSRCRSASRQPR